MILALALVPILAGFSLFALPRRSDELARWIAVAIAGFTAIDAAAAADAGDASWPWLARPFVSNFHFAVGHGPSFWLLELLAVTTLCALTAMRVPRGRDMAAQLLLLLGTMAGVFISRDLLVFALFWDLMLIPVFMILIAWAPSPGASSAWRYLIYNLTGGLALLLAVAGYGALTGTTDVIGLPAGAAVPAIGGAWGLWIFGGIAFAFLIKTPVWPLHTWMPQTYADLPAPAVAVVSAVQSKAGLYGFIVIGLALFPAQMAGAEPLMYVLGLIALVYGALAAIVGDDLKRIVAYSSLSHLGLVLIGIFAFLPNGSVEPIALGGALVYMVAHGLFSAMLFLVIGQVEGREETRELARLGGLGTVDPRLAGALLIAALAALGLPGLCGFAGELLILTGVYRSGHVWPAAIALVPVVLAAGYMLRVFQGTMHGPESKDLPRRADLSWLEGLALAPLVVAIVLLGVNPGPVANAAAVHAGEVALRTPVAK
jgi:NADH-quinone oxidoreductase subunit M